MHTPAREIRSHDRIAWTGSHIATQQGSLWQNFSQNQLSFCKVWKFHCDSLRVASGTEH
jgi:hypothetical protein